MSSVQPFPSGAYPLTTQETDYLTASYRQIIDELSIPIVYKIATITGEDAYEHPVITYTDKVINGVVANITSDEYQYVETGFLPAHYANLWVYDAIPQVGDHVLWMDIEWEVRGSYPVVLGSVTVYYQCLIRRVLTSSVSGGSGGGSGSGSSTTGTVGTLQAGGSGGVTLPQDP